MESTLIIPAGGEQARWASPYPKQLVTVNGETLISRLLRQFKSHLDITVILSDNLAITEPFGYGAYWPADHRCLCETLLNTAHLWGRHTIILLGDVILSQPTARRIAVDLRPCAFWGNWSDILAVSFYESERDPIFNSLLSSASNFVYNKGRGKLWEAYRDYCGFDYDDHRFDNHGIFIDVMDWSRDFDTVEEYEEFVERIKMGDIDVWA